MDAFDRGGPNPRRTCRVHCCICGQSFFDDHLFLNVETDEWCCKDFPICGGSGGDIVIDRIGRGSEFGELSDEQLQKLLNAPFSPPEVVKRVRCIECRDVYPSSDIRQEGGAGCAKTGLNAKDTDTDGTSLVGTIRD